MAKAVELTQAANTIATSLETLGQVIKDHPLAQPEAASVVAEADLDPVLAALTRVNTALQAIIEQLAPSPTPQGADPAATPPQV